MFNKCLPAAAAATKSLQSCRNLCDPIDGSPPGSPVPGILQARTLEWVAISFSNAWKWKVKVESLSCVRLLATPWTAAYQAPQSMGFSRQASLGEKKKHTLICSLCRFLCYKYSQHWIKNWDKTHTVCSSEPAQSSFIIQLASLQYWN